MRLIILGLLLIAALPLPAHHAEPLYDMKNPVTVKGVVARVDWSNPHVFIYLDVRNSQGQKESWTVELNSPNSLRRNGWNNNTLKPGDSITCTGGRSLSGARTIRAAVVELENGKKLKG